MFFPKIPTGISQMVYPEKPSPKQPWRVGTGNSTTSRETKFRIGKQNSDNQPENFWQENVEQWVQSERLHHSEDSRRPLESRDRNRKQKSASNAHDRKHTFSSHNSDTNDSVVLSKEFVHHQGFQGSPESQSTTLKYKFGKKKAATTKENTNQPSTFKPKGYGSLYDELEFERRYKKVFDLNKHIHFVHSNFISGQRLYKRNKLPPIGHIPSIQSDPIDSRDIFAIMSVQRFNHPDEADIPRAPVTSPGPVRPNPVDGFPKRQSVKRNIEISQEVNCPVGFVPGTVKNTGNSPFDGVNGYFMQKEGGYRLSMASRENDSALGTLTEETSRHGGGDDLSCSERSAKTSKSKKTKPSLTDDSKAKKKKFRDSPKYEDNASSVSRQMAKDERPVTLNENTIDEQEPFNISVHVEIKAKDPYINGGDDVENERARERRLPIFEQSESPESEDYDENNEYDRENEDKVLYSTKIHNDASPRSEDTDDGLKVLKPKNIAISTNQYGFVTHKVQYPERFVLRESLVEEDETETEFETENKDDNEETIEKTDQTDKTVE